MENIHSQEDLEDMHVWLINIRQLKQQKQQRAQELVRDYTSVEPALQTKPFRIIQRVLHRSKGFSKTLVSHAWLQGWTGRQGDPYTRWNCMCCTEETPSSESSVHV